VAARAARAVRRTGFVLAWMALLKAALLIGALAAAAARHIVAL
jgi:hypothetical protein